MRDRKRVLECGWVSECVSMWECELCGQCACGCMRVSFCSRTYVGTCMRACMRACHIIHALVQQPPSPPPSLTPYLEALSAPEHILGAGHHPPTLTDSARTLFATSARLCGACSRPRGSTSCYCRRRVATATRRCGDSKPRQVLTATGGAVNSGTTAPRPRAAWPSSGAGLPRHLRAAGHVRGRRWTHSARGLQVHRPRHDRCQRLRAVHVGLASTVP